ncbi:Hypothetical predicted protein [Mytilus galloprovincialis]|uniref:Uncharacterized protein n=1 Tax=Mytilus galloprovincialis TaxID=29158 RepID=A0A8B6CN75_MYTGA|nr:Hypothetical predicted protein [Mytilus galloprovincialis]
MEGGAPTATKTGHKADNNKNNKSCKCTNYPCASIHLCGQADKHPEYLQEKKTKQREILQLKQKIRKLDEEKNQLESFMGVKKTDFMSSMRSRLRQTNPTKYQDGAKLMKDLHSLKIGYNGVVPEDRGNDYVDFKHKLDEMANRSKEVRPCFTIKRKVEDEADEDDKKFPVIHQMKFPFQQFYPQMMPYFPSYPWQYPPPFQSMSTHTKYSDVTGTYKCFWNDISVKREPSAPVHTHPKSSMDLLADAALKCATGIESFDTDCDADDESD